MASGIGSPPLAPPLPEAGITLWQKMAQVAKGTPPVRLSTHPSGEDRMKRTKGALKDVMPLYGKAKSSKPPAAAVSGQGAHPGTAPQKSARSVGTCWRPGMAGALKRVGHRGG